MRIRGLTTVGAVAALAIGSMHNAGAQITDDFVKIGVLNDQSSVYADAAGQGSVVAAEMAISDFGGTVNGVSIELVSADHQNKADVGSEIARSWFGEEGVDVIVDFSNSAVALAVQFLAEQEQKVTLGAGVGSRRFSGDSCSPYGIHWTYDSYALSNSTAGAIVEAGQDRWYFITVDYALGHALEQDGAAVVEANGGEVVGTSRHPLGAPDFSSYLLSAQSAEANVLGLANTTADAVNAIKQAREFGITDQMDIAALFMLVTDVHGLGLDAAQGIYLTLGYYWDMDEESREFAERFYERVGRMPTMVQAGVYSSITHYLKSIEEAGTDEAGTVVETMKALPVEDFFGKGGHIREDGRSVFDMYLFQVKSPEESAYDWDYLELVDTIPGEEAFFPLDQSECKLVQ